MSCHIIFDRKALSSGLSRLVSGRELVELGMRPRELLEKVKSGRFTPLDRKTGQPIVSPPREICVQSLKYFEKKQTLETLTEAEKKEIDQYHEALIRMMEDLADNQFGYLKLTGVDAFDQAIMEPLLSADYLVEEVLRATEINASQSMAETTEGKTHDGQTSFSFYRDGDIWFIGKSGHERKLRHSKGLARIHFLLSASGREFHIEDMGELSGSRSAMYESVSETIERIRREHLCIGEYLMNCIRIGSYPKYEHKNYNIQWDLSPPRG